MKTLGLIILLATLHIQVSAQKDNRKLFDPINDNIEDFIPPLEAIIDSAIQNSAILKIVETDIRINDVRIKSIRNEWLKNIKLGSNIRYGTNDNLALDPIAGSALYTSSIETRYGASASLSIPLYNMFNKKNAIKFVELEKQQAAYNLEAKTDELRKEIIVLYNQLKIQQQLLKLAADYVQTSAITMNMAEKQFLNGQIQISEYSKVAESNNSSISAFKSSMQDFLTTLMLLEEVAGIKFSLI